MKTKQWIKIYVDNWLRGSIKEESLEVRGAFVGILALAGNSAYGDKGIIQFAEGMGYTDEQLASILRTDVANWLAIKKRLVDADRIKVDSDNIIWVLNWKKYQTEYDRQKLSQLKQRIKKKKINCNLQDNSKQTQNSYDRIFKHWNSLNIIKHKQLTEKMKRKINDRLNEGYSVEEILLAISNYATILKEPQFYWTYKWVLVDFLTRGMNKFKDWDIASANYEKDKDDKDDTKPIPCAEPPA